MVDVGARGRRRRRACATGRPRRRPCSATPCRPPSRPASCAGWSARCEGGEPPGDEPPASVTPPTFRPDLEPRVDLIEEVGRIAGYGLAPETLPRHTHGGRLLTQRQKVRRAIAGALWPAAVWTRSITYAFIAPDALAPLGLPEGDRRAWRRSALTNPMSVEQSVMRTMLLPGLLGAVRDNLDRLADRVGVFELGRVYLPGTRRDVPAPVPGRKDTPAPWLPHEPETVGIVLCGPLAAESWTGARAGHRLLHAQGLRRAPAGRGLAVAGAPSSDSAEPFLHPGKSADLLLGVERVGSLGLLRPDVGRRLRHRRPAVYVAELTVARSRRAGLDTALFEDLGTYPPACAGPRRRASPPTCRPRRSWTWCAAPAASLLREASRVRRLRGRPGAARQALAGRAPRAALAERTLTDKDITGVRRKILAALERELEATLRQLAETSSATGFPAGLGRIGPPGLAARDPSGRSPAIEPVAARDTCVRAEMDSSHRLAEAACRLASFARLA